MPEELRDIIIKKIRSNGEMPLGEFISLALCHPEYGYYMKSDPFGIKGDFTTAPEISQIFGELIGAWIIDVWMQMGGPSFNLIECGAGRGTLMSDILRVGGGVKGFTDNVNVHIVENSHVMRSMQKKSLKPYINMDQVHWSCSIEDLECDDFVYNPCIIFGNEFLDALPVEQISSDGRGCKQRFLSVDDVNNKTLCFVYKPASDELMGCLPKEVLINRVYEVSPERIRFINDCANIIYKSGGACLFIDYGHTKSGYGDTLQAVKNHRYSDILKDIGSSDITSHVDFESLVNEVVRCFDKISILPLVTQRDFLKDLGVDYRSRALKESVPSQEEKAGIENDVDRLIGRNKMGDLFKVMCFYKAEGIHPCGFGEVYE